MKTTPEYDIQAKSFLFSNGLKFRATLSNTKTPPWKDGDGQHGNHYRVTISRTARRPPTTYSYRGKEMAGYQGDATYVRHTNHPQRLTFDFWGSIRDAGFCSCKECKGEGKIRSKKEELETYPHPEAGQPVKPYTRTLIKSLIKRGDKEAADRIFKSTEKHPATLTRYVRPIVPCTACKGTGNVQGPDFRHPSAYDVLACISSDIHCEESFADFCSDFGYETDSIKAKQTHGRCLAFSKRLRAFFTPSELEQLAEIQ